MEYVSVAEARAAKGLRITLTGGLPAPWSESAKGLFRVRNVDYMAVFQEAGGPNEEILAWTGHRNAPTAMYNDEHARINALDMICLAERLGSGPSLVPDDIDQRIRMYGLLNEIAGENGLAWNARVVMFANMIAMAGEAAMVDNPMLKDYHYDAAAVELAPAKIIAILGALAAQLRRQEEASRYFIGESLTALDIYWACFSQMLQALPPEVNPMPDSLRGVWGQLGQTVQAAGYEFDPILLEHRDYIFPKYLRWPLDF